MPAIVSKSIQVHVARRIAAANEYEYLVIRRSPDRMIFPGLWQVVTGWIEPGESPVQAALREMLEETGLAPARMWTLPYIAMFFNPEGDEVNAAPVFGAIVDAGAQVVLSNEHTDYEWLGYDECAGRLELPTHRKGARIFKEYVLDAANRDIFIVNL